MLPCPVRLGKHMNGGRTWTAKGSAANALVRVGAQSRRTVRPDRTAETRVASPSHSPRIARRPNRPLITHRLVLSGARFSRPGRVRGAEGCISNRHSCRLETDDPSRIKRGRPGRPARGAWGIIPSDQREPRDLSPLRVSRRRSNRHPCRLETIVNPFPPAATLFLIVTQSGVICAHSAKKKSSHARARIVRRSLLLAKANQP